MKITSFEYEDKKELKLKKKQDEVEAKLIFREFDNGFDICLVSERDDKPQFVSIIINARNIVTTNRFDIYPKSGRTAIKLIDDTGLTRTFEVFRDEY